MSTGVTTPLKHCNDVIKDITARKGPVVTERNPNVLLANHIAASAASAGLSWDTYDADFLLGVVQAWLRNHEAVLTPLGVEKL